MSKRLDVDICVIGAGAAGLVTAAGAAQLGAPTVLIERGEMGGECLNTGCVPSKSLLAAAHAASLTRAASGLGVNADSQVDFEKVKAHVAQVIAEIAPHDSQERFEDLGATVLREEARFTGVRSVQAGETEIRARRFVIATGSRPVIPPIPGLAETAFLTTETIFQQPRRPDHLLIIGGGAVGVELAQAYRRLGSGVTLVDQGCILPREDCEAVTVLRDSLLADGVILHEGVAIGQVGSRKNEIRLTLADGVQIAGDALLVATGRRPLLDGLDLHRAGIKTNKAGMILDRRLRTTNRRVYAAGDVAGAGFTHMAGHQAGIVIRNVLFRLPAKATPTTALRVIYTDPELAQVGLTELEARERGKAVRILTQPYARNDRAQAENRLAGFVKATVTPGGRILGATIVGEQAGELIQLWALAIAQKLKIGAIATMIAPYPTLGELSKSVAGQFYTDRLFSDRTRWLVRQLRRLG